MKFCGMIWLIAVFSLGQVRGRIHTLPLKDDERSVIVITSFGYLKGGSLEVNITGLKIYGKGLKDETKIGFSLDKSSSSDESSYVEREESSRGCVLDQETDKDMFENVPRAILKIARGVNGTYQLKVAERGLNGLKFYDSKHAYEAQLKNTNKPDESAKAASEITENTDKDVKETDTEQGQPGDGKDEPGKEPAKSEGKDEETDDGTTKVESTEKPVNGDVESTVDTAPSNADAKTALKVDTKPEGDKDEDENGNKSPGARRKREAVPEGVKITSKKDSDKEYIAQSPLRVVGDFKVGMNISFYVRMENEDQIGLYELYFHNCENIVVLGSPKKKVVTAEFTAQIVEKNGESYLSAGDMALPLMYGVISALFFFVSLVWLQVLCGTKEIVFKIHYLMAVIVFIKGLSVMFHSLDYYFIGKDGRTEAWAVIYYIVHLLKGVLLIICLLLIGTGWAFIKYILSNRDKKLFMIVIPMQVMVNVAYVIMEETEEGNRAHFTWKEFAILVDVLCCGAILIPVVWSIRHLQEASQTDGKAAINLAKLELFRHFYILVVCYLYFTRIIVYLLEITLPFHYIWVHALFAELGALAFFAVTGYKFRPGCDNPYLKLEQYDEDDPEEVLTQSGATETLSRVNQREKDADETDEFDVLLPKQRTSKV